MKIEIDEAELFVIALFVCIIIGCAVGLEGCKRDRDFKKWELEHSITNK